MITIESLIEEIGYIRKKNSLIFAKTPAAKRMLKRYGQINATSIQEEVDNQIDDLFIKSGWTKERYYKYLPKISYSIIRDANDYGEFRATEEVNNNNRQCIKVLPEYNIDDMSLFNEFQFENFMMKNIHLINANAKLSIIGKNVTKEQAMALLTEEELNALCPM